MDPSEHHKAVGPAAARVRRADPGDGPTAVKTVVIDVRGLRFASEQARVERMLGQRPGLRSVVANPVAQTATVTYDPAETSLGELRSWVTECGYHCAGRSVPNHVCDPMGPDDANAEAAPPASSAHPPATDHDMGHGPTEATEMAGHHDHGGMSMADMARDMRNRFVVAAVFALAITMYSHIGMEILKLDLPIPLGMRPDVWQLLLSLPVIFYSAGIFFTGAVAALRARTLDMMVLVAVGIGTGWLYSVGVTLNGGGTVFYSPCPAPA